MEQATKESDNTAPLFKWRFPDKAMAPNWPGIAKSMGLNCGQEAFSLLTGPGVYIFWKAETALYVGKGDNVFRRASDPGHHKAPKFLPEFEEVTFIPAASPMAALELESLLIASLNPLHNEVSRKIDDGVKIWQQRIVSYLLKICRTGTKQELPQIVKNTSTSENFQP